MNRDSRALITLAIFIILSVLLAVFFMAGPQMQHRLRSMIPIVGSPGG